MGQLRNISGETSCRPVNLSGSQGPKQGINKGILQRPTLVTHKLSGVKKFSKVDAFKGLFAYHIDRVNESSMKTIPPTHHLVSRHGCLRDENGPNIGMIAFTLNCYPSNIWSIFILHTYHLW